MNKSRSLLLMRKLILILFLSNFILILHAKEVPTFDEKLILEHIKKMKDDPVKARYTSIVKSYLKRYLYYGRGGSERILGKSIMYFPLFEESLKSYELPDELKYLSIVESALDPSAVSRVGAVGLWQFMPATAGEVGLKMNKYVDERRDPYKSTDAAMRYLKQQYKRFGSWELALAAYNGGGGRVSRAIKRGRSKDFWRIRQYLPKETSNYIPAYIAACYLGKFYEKHDLNPSYPQLDAQLTSTLTIYNYLAFLKISKVTGLSTEEIAVLNPAYKKDFIPSSQEGNTLTLPTRVMPVMQLYFEANKPDSGEKIDEESLISDLKSSIPDKEIFYKGIVYIVKEGENIHELAQTLSIKTHHICAWNKMSFYQNLLVGQELLLYGVVLPESMLQIEEEPIVVAILEEVDALPSKPIDLVNEQPETLLPNTFEREKHLYYIVGANENLSQIASKFAGISARDIMILNNFRSTQIPKAGREIRVKKM